jgi:hypothetical protein
MDAFFVKPGKYSFIFLPAWVNIQKWVEANNGQYWQHLGTVNYSRLLYNVKTTRFGVLHGFCQYYLNERFPAYKHLI